MSQAILELKNVTKHFEIGSGFLKPKKLVHAVENVDLEVYEGETLGIVGESGSGKSTLARLIMRLIPATGGEVFFKGEDLLTLSRSAMSERRKHIQMVFQDPYASLNPRFTVGYSISEALLTNHIVEGKKQAEERAKELLELVGLLPEVYHSYPHEFSGGQRQRICIARAIALQPQLLLCDEAVSALDVSVQAQVLNLLNDLKDELNLTYIFITHDLAVVKYISDRIMVMYLGQVMELAPADKLFEHVYHPYTEALISAIPEPVVDRETNRILLEGDIPSPVNPPAGCPFHTRCPKVCDRCRETLPALREIEPGHLVRCHLYEEGGEI